MENAISIFTLIFLMITIFILLEARNTDVIYVTSPIDNEKYLVRNLPDKKKAADILAITRKKLMKLCDDEVRLPLVKITDNTKAIVKKALETAKLI